jgi:hypothetical protein
MRAAIDPIHAQALRNAHHDGYATINHTPIEINTQ